MSNSDNIQRKILMNNPLKTNILSNTNGKLKLDNQKRFSNIGREKQQYKQLQRQRNTIQKNTSRYYQQIDLQGSATILPQKNSSRQNIYINQNTNQNINQANNIYHQNNTNNNNIKKQYQNSNANSQFMNMKSKSPSTQNTSRLIIEQTNNNSKPYLNNLLKKVQPNQLTINNNKNPEILLTQRQRERQRQREKQREKSLKQYKVLSNPNIMPIDQQRQQRQNHNSKMNNKMKSMIFLNTKQQIDEDLICNEQIDIPLSLLEKYDKKQTNHIQTHKIINHNSNQQDIQYKTQKKNLYEKGQNHNLLEKNKSEHNLNLHKQPTIITKNHTTSNNNLISNANTNSQSYFCPATITKQLSKSLLIPPINYDQEMKKFYLYQNQVNIITEIEKLELLSNRHKDYTVQPNYIELKQKNFNWYMRAVLMDWMIHVCYQFSLKRQTYYISVNLADKYLEQTNDLPKSEFQLVGAASMYIAAKLQQFQALSSVDFSKSTDNRYSPNDIKQMQLKICKVLIYQLNPPTLFMWANRFMAHWDNYILLTEAKNHPYFDTHAPKFFKKDSQQSYILFREMMQMLDCSILDVQTLQFSPKIIVCSFMYLVLGKNYKQWSVKRIVQQFPRSSHYLVSQDDLNCFNNLFHMYLVDSFNINILELLPAVQYCSTYFTLPLNFDEPSISNKNQSQEENQMGLQQYESFQTYNAKMIDLVKKRYRGVYL